MSTPPAPAPPPAPGPAPAKKRPLTPQERARRRLQKRAATQYWTQDLGVRGGVFPVALIGASLYLLAMAVFAVVRGQPWELTFVYVLGCGALLWLLTEFLKASTAAFWLTGLLMVLLAAFSGWRLSRDPGRWVWPGLGIFTAVLMLDFLRKRRHDFLAGGLEALAQTIKPYAETPLSAPAGGRRAPLDVLLALNNRIARAGKICAVAEDEARALAAEHGVDLARDVHGGRQTLYMAYLKHFLASDGGIGPGETAELACLQKLLALDDRTVAGLRKPYVDNVYQRRVRTAMADGTLSPTEQAELDALRAAGALSDDDARALRAREGAGAYEDAVKKVLADARLDASDVERLLELAKTLGIPDQTARKVLADHGRGAYARALEAAAAAGGLDAAETARLEAMRAALGIPDDEARDLRVRAGRGAYGKTVETAMADGALTPQESEALRSLETAGELDADRVQRTRWEAAAPHLREVVKDAMKDERLSPDEEREIRELGAGLGVKVELEAATRETLQRYRLLWQIENAELPVVPSEVPLEPGETCHAEAMAQVHDYRTVVTGKRYEVERESAKEIMVQEKETTTRELRVVDSGPLVVTDRRIVFRGRDGMESYHYERVQEVFGSRKSVDIIREGRPSRRFELDGDAEVFARTAERARRDFRNKLPKADPLGF